MMNFDCPYYRYGSQARRSVNVPITTKYTEKYGKCFTFKCLNTSESVTYVVTPESNVARIIIHIWLAGIAPSSSSETSKLPAVIGKNIKNDNSFALARDNFAINAPEIVDPDRDTPGKMPSIWAKPANKLA